MKFKIALFPALFLLVACGHTQQTVQREEASLLKLVGHWNGVTVELDDNEPFELRSTILEPGGGKTERVEEAPDYRIFQVKPGKHRLRVTRDGGVVLDRILFLTNGVTTEVAIP